MIIASKKSLKRSITNKEKIFGFFKVGGMIQQESYDKAGEKITGTMEASSAPILV